MNYFKLVFIALFASVFVACEGNTTKEFVIDNTTSDTVIVSFRGIKFSEEQTQKIGPKTQNSIYYIDVLGGNESPGLVSEVFDYVTIYNLVGDTISPDLLDNAAWDIVSEHKSKVPSNYYHTFTFTQN